jgi:hypothetical protein
MVWIAGATATGTGNLSLSSIPSTFTHLQLKVTARNSASTNQNVWVSFNGDFGSTSYAWHRLTGDGTSASSSAGTGQNVILVGYVLGTAVATQVYGSAIVDILDYTNTNKNKVVRSIYGVNNNDSTQTNQQVGIFSGVWLSTAAINKIDFGIIGDNLGAGTRIDLYGITSSQVTGA